MTVAVEGKITSLARDRHSADAAQGLSIVVPLYNEAATLERLHALLIEVAQRLAATRALACEVVYVDDGSRDGTLAIARELPATALDVQVVSLSRNFGKEAALLAGLDHARLGAVLFMDGDGQHPPALIERLVGHWLDDGYDSKGVLRSSELGRAPEDSGRCRRLSSVIATRGQCAATAPGAQPVLQRAVELDRLSPDAHRL